MNNNNSKQSLLLGGLLFACLLCTITRPGVSGHTLSHHEPVGKTLEPPPVLDDDIDDGDGRSGMAKEDDEPMGSRSGDNLVDEDNSGSRGSPNAPEPEDTPPVGAPRAANEPAEEGAPRGEELPEPANRSDDMRSDLPAGGEGTPHDHSRSAMPMEQPVEGERSDLPESEHIMTTLSPKMAPAEPRSDNLDDDGLSRTEPLEPANDASRSTELPPAGSMEEHQRPAEPVEKKEEPLGSRSSLDDDDGAGSRGAGAAAAAETDAGDWEIDNDDEGNSRSGMSADDIEEGGSRADPPAPGEDSVPKNVTISHHAKPHPRPFWNPNMHPTTTTAAPTTTTKSPATTTTTKPVAPTTTKPPPTGWGRVTIAASPKPTTVAPHKPTTAAPPKPTTGKPTTAKPPTTVVPTTEASKPKPTPAICPPAFPEARCSCDYKEMKDSDRLLAVVMTKKGGFKGRRINGKAFTVLMSGGKEDKNSSASGVHNPQLDKENNFVFPAGHYYFPNPIRFASFRL